MSQEGKCNTNTIWVVVNAEDTQGKPNATNARGCYKLCNARVGAQADMLYKELSSQAVQLNEGDRIVMHQGGARSVATKQRQVEFHHQQPNLTLSR